MFKSGSLETPPKQSELHFWADYVELRCLTDPDGQFSIDRLLQSVKFAGDLEQVNPDAQDADDADIADLFVSVADGALDSFDLIPEDIEETDDDYDPEEELGYSDVGRAAEIRDDARRWSEDVFRLLSSRADLLGSIYPFAVSGDAASLTKAEETEARLAYVFYLCCSSLRYVDKRTQSRLTSLFELASADVLRLLLPAPAVVDVFGTARGAGSSQFSGSLHERITALAAELRGKVVVDAVDFHPKDTADNGLDLVAWIPLGDEQPGIPSFFAQCACGGEWKSKQSEAGYLQRWHRFISLAAPPTTLTFIPHFFRKAGGHWSSDSDIETVVVDRLRALLLYANEVGTTQTLPLDYVRTAWEFQLQSV